MDVQFVEGVFDLSNEDGVKQIRSCLKGEEKEAKWEGGGEGGVEGGGGDDEVITKYNH